MVSLAPNSRYCPSTLTLGVPQVWSDLELAAIPGIRGARDERHDCGA